MASAGDIKLAVDAALALLKGIIILCTPVEKLFPRARAIGEELDLVRKCEQDWERLRRTPEKEESVKLLVHSLEQLEECMKEALAPPPKPKSWWWPADKVFIVKRKMAYPKIREDMERLHEEVFRRLDYVFKGASIHFIVEAHKITMKELKRLERKGEQQHAETRQRIVEELKDFIRTEVIKRMKEEKRQPEKRRTTEPVAKVMYILSIPGLWLLVPWDHAPYLLTIIIQVLFIWASQVALSRQTFFRHFFRYLKSIASFTFVAWTACREVLRKVFTVSSVMATVVFLMACCVMIWTRRPIYQSAAASMLILWAWFAVSSISSGHVVTVGERVWDAILSLSLRDITIGERASHVLPRKLMAGSEACFAFLASFFLLWITISVLSCLFRWWLNGVAMTEMMKRLVEEEKRTVLEQQARQMGTVEVVPVWRQMYLPASGFILPTPSEEDVLVLEDAAKVARATVRILVWNW